MGRDCGQLYKSVTFGIDPSPYTTSTLFYRVDWLISTVDVLETQIYDLGYSTL